MKRQNCQFTKFISLLKFPGLQYTGTSEMFSCHGDTCTFHDHQVTVLGSQLPWKQIFVLAYIVARVNAGLKLKQQSSCSKMSML